ncbi:putative membrane protein insertion efficiency factor [Actinoplanes octamycinicus]|uniref:Putative membrane protein insertion efficiency factor n=1 Tax=Actinoplanes octamycinicus TaxID=135948 RepID=A0A7W7H8N9_9ACTN|nr:membrane protein insertion efficiency factor YidD [Actinoplanes octamycinicus]MBB4745627.1 putative membrane protein insertion efficiency factor [Actinoplanes octamycinicus]
MESVPDDPQPEEQKKDRWYDACDCDGGCCDLGFLGCDLFRLSTLLTIVALLGHRSTARPTERMVTGAIRGYRKVSPRLPTRCRYQPTCSAYALTAIERYGLGKGLRLAAARLRRCGPRVPFGTGDPVP